MSLMDIIKKSAVWIIIIGTISWAVALATGNIIPTYIVPHTIDYGNGVTTTLYQFDITNYIKGIQTAVRVPINKMFYNPPAFPTINWSNILVSIPNIFIWLLNEMIWWFNIVLFVPLKILQTPLIFYLSLLGINLENYGIIEFIYKLYTITPPIIGYI